VIHIGIDDTDTPDTEGTNQLARHIACNLPAGFSAQLIVRHQLLLDPRIPYTSGNGCASILVNAQSGADTELLLATVRQAMQQWFKPGSDPGLCMARQVAPELTAFGARCQQEPVTQMEARALAAAHGVHLEALGGSEDGVIGALAAVGLLAGGNDGRIIHLPGWNWPDKFSATRSVEEVRARGVEFVRDEATGSDISEGVVETGKHLRPARRGGRVVLFVERGSDTLEPRWRALRLP
jgi:tRNA(Ile2) C34 agmatinyltransferase TiaS